jgi:hypothetical protein
MHTADGALKLSGSWAEVPVKSMLALRLDLSIEICTRITAPLSISYANAPSFRTSITRRTASSALSWTCCMYAFTTSRPKCSTMRRSSCTPVSFAATWARRSARFCSTLRDG